MRLGDILSKPPKLDFVQVDGFLQNKKGDTGQTVELTVGNIALNYFCKTCDDIRTFRSRNKFSCMFIDKKTISIDCVLACSCGATVPIWFLVESMDDITLPAPSVRIMKKSEKLSDSVAISMDSYGFISKFLDKADVAYRDELGAGALVYLRKAFEAITLQTATSLGIITTKKNGSSRPFVDILRDIDAQNSIIPPEFSANGYKLFSELSNVIHGASMNDTDALKKYQPLRRLVVGILENVKNREEFSNAKRALGWN